MRQWRSEGSTVLFLGLNPSQADGERDDPTLRRLRGLATRWGHGRLLVMNLFARVNRDPALLRRVIDPVGEETDRWLVTALAWMAQQRREPPGPPPRVWVGWGERGGLYGREGEVVDLLQNWGVDVVCVGLTRQGQPRHPLYCRADHPPQPFVMPPLDVTRPS